MKKLLKINNPWFLIVIFVLFLSLPSIFRIWCIKNLYISKDVQNLAVKSTLALRDTYGMGATDTKLKRITVDKNKTVFYFDYSYNYPGLDEEKEKYFIEFIDNNLKNIGKDEK